MSLLVRLSLFWPYKKKVAAVCCAFAALLAFPLLAGQELNTSASRARDADKAQKIQKTEKPAEKLEKPGSLSHALKYYQVASADRPHLAKIEDYLTGLTTLESDFIQTASGGDVTTGKFYLQRPGRLRMEYNPPTPILLVTNGSSLVYYDKDLKQVTNIPLSGTLVGFLTRDKVRFDNSVKIINFTRRPGSLRVTIVQTDRPRDGLLTLEFQDKPLKIRNIVITDSGGQITTVSLNNARFGSALDKALFTFRDPRKKYPNVPD